MHLRHPTVLALSFTMLALHPSTPTQAVPSAAVAAQATQAHNSPTTQRPATQHHAPRPAAETYRLRAAVRQLPVRREIRSGYDRDLFGDWVDVDGDCRDTRDEVLAQESREPVGDACDVTAGVWRSYYDGATWRSSSDVDIDHVVPLAEAWDSGARAWGERRRVRYANDLGDRRSLVAVTDNVNQSKGDRDPAEWLPERRVCRYVAEYVAVKLRWNLRVDRAERRALREQARSCTNRVVVVRRVVR
jgi:hypothetical protein